MSNSEEPIPKQAILWESTLQQLPLGVLLVDMGNQLVFANPSAREIIGLSKPLSSGVPVKNAISSPELVDFISQSLASERFLHQIEFSTDNEENILVQANLIPNFGLAIYLRKISLSEKTDRLQGNSAVDFVHNLRSPLTAVYGYVDLLGRVGPINEKQIEFIERIRRNLMAMNEKLSTLLEDEWVEPGDEGVKNTPGDE